MLIYNLLLWSYQSFNVHVHVHVHVHVCNRKGQPKSCINCSLYNIQTQLDGRVDRYNVDRYVHVGGWIDGCKT